MKIKATVEIPDKILLQFVELARGGGFDASEFMDTLNEFTTLEMKSKMGKKLQEAIAKELKKQTT